MHKFAFMCLILYFVPVLTTVQAQTNEIDSLKQQCNFLEQKVSKLEIELNSNIIAAQKIEKKADRIINFSGIYLGIAGILVTLLLAIGVIEFIKINSIRKEYQDELDKIKVSKEEILSRIELNYNNIMGTMFYNLGENSKSREFFNKVVDKEPQNLKVLYYIANSFRQESKFKDSIKIYNDILTIDPEYSEAHYGKGLCDWLANNYKSALEHYEMAIKINPTKAKFYNRLGTAYRVTDLDKALDIYLDGYKLKKTANSAFNIGLIYFAKSNVKEQEKYLNLATHYAEEELTLTSSPTWQYHFLAVISLLENNFPKSQNYFSKALRSKDTNEVRQGMKSDLYFIENNLNNINKKRYPALKQNSEKLIKFIS